VGGFVRADLFLCFLLKSLLDMVKACDNMAWLVQDGRDKSSSDIAPCSTLFIANLGRTCTEDELKEVLSKYDAQILLFFGDVDSKQRY
jgi:hypothetical protein